MPSFSLPGWPDAQPELRSILHDVHPAILGSVCLAFLFLVHAVYRARTHPLRSMPGPALASWFWGSTPKGVPDPAALFTEQAWVKEFGTTFKFRGFVGSHVLYSDDMTALRHILSNGDVYQKPEGLRYMLGNILGHGLLFVEGEEHKKQRRIMNPAFGPMQVNRFTDLFLSKSKKMTDIWMDLCAKTTRPDGCLKLDVFAWLNKATLDIIGLAGFDYAIDALSAPDDAPNALNEAVRIMLSFEGFDAFAILQAIWKPLRMLPSVRKYKTAKANRTIREIGLRLIAEKKAAILAEGGGDEVKHKDFEGRDLLSLLIKSNMASDLPESARMSDEDILAQVPTFIVAGHETTSTAVAWSLFAMSCSQRIQEKLRAEVRSLATDIPTATDLNALVYLDYVVRETLRVYAPVHSTERIATRDDVVPLREPYTDVRGVVHHEVCMRKGDSVTIPIASINRKTQIWGDDAHEFRPERWENLPAAAKDMPSAWGSVATFISGQHACIGWRFSVMEIKALLFMIVRSFEFELGVSPADIMGRTMVVTRPSLVSHPAGGSQLPLVIRPVTT